eukprot:5502949-Pleurochrysis_carterae.AAC.4
MPTHCFRRCWGINANHLSKSTSEVSEVLRKALQVFHGHLDMTWSWKQLTSVPRPSENCAPFVSVDVSDGGLEWGGLCRKVGAQTNCFIWHIPLPHLCQGHVYQKLVLRDCILVCAFCTFQVDATCDDPYTQRASFIFQCHATERSDVWWDATDGNFTQH